MKFFFGKYKDLPVESADAGYILWTQEMLTKHTNPSKKHKALLEYINETQMKLIEETTQQKAIEKAEKDAAHAKWRMLAMLSQHAKYIDDKITFTNIEVTNVKYHEQYDFWTHSFLDGNNIIHCHSSKLTKLKLKVGDLISFEAKVKKHKTWNGINSTTVSYPKNIHVTEN